MFPQDVSSEEGGKAGLSAVQEGRMTQTVVMRLKGSLQEVHHPTHEGVRKRTESGEEDLFKEATDTNFPKLNGYEFPNRGHKYPHDTETTHGAPQAHCHDVTGMKRDPGFLHREKEI